VSTIWNGLQLYGEGRSSYRTGNTGKYQPYYSDGLVNENSIGFEIATAVTMEVMFFWLVAAC
jgi:hypothetical protein